MKHETKAIAVKRKEDEISSDGGVPPEISASVPPGPFSFAILCAAGFISLVDTVLQAVDGCLNYGQKAEQHDTAFKLFTKMRYRLEVMVGSTYEDDGHIVARELTDWIQDYAEVLEKAPVVHQDVYEKAMRDMEEEGSKQCPEPCPKWWRLVW